jgi:hypothetical protein
MIILIFFSDHLLFVLKNKHKRYMLKLKTTLTHGYNHINNAHWLRRHQSQLHQALQPAATSPAASSSIMGGINNNMLLYMYTHSLVNKLTERSLYLRRYDNTVRAQMPLHDQRVEHFTPEIAVVTDPEKRIRYISISIYVNMLER